MTPETPVERRLRLLHDNAAAFDFIEPTEDAEAIRVGREALALLRRVGTAKDAQSVIAWEHDRRALIARCGQEGT